MTATVTKLRKLRPFTVLVYDGDDDDGKTIKVGTGRKCWDRAAQTLAGMEWTRAECVDKDGNVLGVIRNDDRELGDGRNTRPSADVLNQYLDVLLRAQKEALTQNKGLVEPVMEAMTRMVDGATKRADTLERSTLNLLRLVGRVTVQAAENEADAIVAEAEREAEAAGSGNGAADGLVEKLIAALVPGGDKDEADAGDGKKGKGK